MEPISLIVAALVAGAATGAGEAAATAVKDAYAELRDRLRKRLAQPAAEAAVEEYVGDPDVGSAVLEAHLKRAGADRDEAVLAAAARLMELVDATGAAAGKYTVNLAGAQGVQVGDHGTQTNYFGSR